MSNGNSTTTQNAESVFERLDELFNPTVEALATPRDVIKAAYEDVLGYEDADQMENSSERIEYWEQRVEGGLSLDELASTMVRSVQEGRGTLVPESDHDANTAVVSQHESTLSEDPENVTFEDISSSASSTRSESIAEDDDDEEDDETPPPEDDDDEDEDEDDDSPIAPDPPSDDDEEEEDEPADLSMEIEVQAPDFETADTGEQPFDEDAVRREDSDEFQALSNNGLGVRVDDNNVLAFESTTSQEGVVEAGSTSSGVKTDAVFVDTNVGETTWGVDGGEFDGQIDHGANGLSLDGDANGWDGPGGLNIYEAVTFEDGDNEYALLANAEDSGTFEGVGGDAEDNTGVGFGVVDLETGEHWQGDETDNFEMGGTNFTAETIDDHWGDKIDPTGVGYLANEFVEEEPEFPIEVQSDASTEAGDVAFDDADAGSVTDTGDGWQAFSFQGLGVTIDEAENGDPVVSFDFRTDNGDSAGASPNDIKADAYFFSTDVGDAEFDFEGTDDNEFAGTWEFNGFTFDGDANGWEGFDSQNVYQAFFIDTNESGEADHVILPHAGQGTWEAAESNDEDGFGLVDLDTGEHLQEDGGFDFGGANVSGEDILESVDVSESTDLDVVGTGYWANEYVAEANG